MKKVEKSLVAFSIFALGLNLLLLPGGNFLTVLGFGILSMIYLYFSFALFNNIRLRKILKKDSYKDVSSLRILGAIGTGFGLSLTIVGLTFKFMSWPGANYNLILGLFLLSIVTVIGVIKYSQNKSEFYTRILKRVAIFGGIGLIVVLIPMADWIGFRYRNYPEYVKAVKNSIADPNNKVLKEKADEELRKMHIERDKK